MILNRRGALGLAALAACGLLVYATPVKTLLGAVAVAAIVWAVWRVLGRKRP